MNGSTPSSVQRDDLITDLCNLRPEDLESFVQTRTDLLSPQTVAILSDLVRERVRVDVGQALVIAEAALSIANRLADPASLGLSLRAKANALWFRGDCGTAVELFARAVTQFELTGMTEEIGRTLSSSIQALSLLGEYDRAYAAADRARVIFQSLGDKWRIARLELNVANIHHRQDRFADALAVYERAYQDLLTFSDSEGVSAALHNMAVCLVMMNDFGRALRCYETVRELCRANSMPLLAVQAEYNIAYLHFLRGDYAVAVEALSRTQTQSRSSGDKYHPALCDLDLAEIYLELNLTEEAARRAADAQQQFESLGMRFETGRALACLAIAKHRQRSSSEALHLFAQARNIFETEGNSAWQALIDLYHAMVLCETGSYDESRVLCWRAKEFFASVPLKRRECDCDLLLARVSLESRDVAACADLCRTVLQRTRSIQAPLMAFRAHLLMGHAKVVQKNFSGAFDSYHEARLELEALRSNLQGEELKISFIKDKTDVYQCLISVCLDGGVPHSPDLLFDLMEKGKSRSLAEIVNGTSRQLGRSGNSDSKANEMRTLSGELNWLYHRIELEQTGRDAVSAQRIHELRQAARHTEDAVIRALREQDRRRGFADVPAAAAAAEPDEIRTALGANSVLVEYFQTGGQFIAAVVDAASTTVVRLSPIRQVTSRVQMLEFQLSKFRLGGAYAEAFNAELLRATEKRLQELYEDLIKPLAPFLNRDHIVIVPHGILHYVPFHALFDGSEYLIDRFTVSFAPSASIYAACTRRSANSVGASLLMGVHDKNAPLIEDEVRSIAQIVTDPRVYVGSSATESVLRALGPTSRLIHIAAHAIFRRDNAMFSSVRLADSYVNLCDLYELSLPVELLTLSGCGTGLSVVAPGDELVGLSRGVLIAGAQTVMLSLWDVHDGTTAELMSCFYKLLMQGCSKAAALRGAMRATRSRSPHPYYWAPFYLVGKVED